MAQIWYNVTFNWLFTLFLPRIDYFVTVQDMFTALMRLTIPKAYFNFDSGVQNMYWPIIPSAFLQLFANESSCLSWLDGAI